MATYTFDKIEYGSNTYVVSDSGALQLTGGQATGPVTFGDSVAIDEATIGDLVINGNASFTNNIQANTINGVEVGSTPKFTDTVASITTSGSGNAITSITASNGVFTATKGTTFLTSHQDISGKADKATTLAGYGITDAKIASGTITLGSNTITPLTSSSTLNAAKLSGAIPSAVTATTQASTDNSTKIATTAYVTTAIANLPEPMIFKGSVGTGGTVTSLPTAAAANEGWTYKVITALSSPSAKVGDTVISNGNSWVVIPSGDEPSGTVTSVGVSNATNGGLTISDSPVTSSGTITIGHSNILTNAQTTQAVYPIKIDKNGHISAYGSAVTIPTNWLDGSAAGSVRTINSATEDENYTIGQYAVAEGYNSKASGYNSHAEGNQTTASDSNAHTEGYNTTASNSNAHAEGGTTTASGVNSHAEGAGTTASGAQSHAEGDSTIASGGYSHAEGSGTTASGASSHAEGSGTNATNLCSHAEGAGTTANGEVSHAEGARTTASGTNSHTEGTQTIANHKSQHVFGEWNIADPSTAQNTAHGNYVEIVGNGTSDSARSNARTLDWNGNEVLAGKLTVGTVGTNSMDVATVGQIPTVTLNGTATASPSFYAPTTAGTNGYVLKSNGSGAPTWTSATNVLDFYPVGSYYETSDSNFNPNNTWGGTWELEEQGFVHISAGADYVPGNTYGANTKSYTPQGTVNGHKLVASEIPAHTHGSKTLTGSLYAYAWADGTSSGIISKSTKAKNANMSSGSNIGHINYTVTATHEHTSVGGNGTHSHGFTGTAATLDVMQSSKPVYRWHRTA